MEKLSIHRFESSENEDCDLGIILGPPSLGTSCRILIAMINLKEFQERERF